jgi:hypothetical protein
MITYVKNHKIHIEKHSETSFYEKTKCGNASQHRKGLVNGVNDKNVNNLNDVIDLNQ